MRFSGRFSGFLIGWVCFVSTAASVAGADSYLFERAPRDVLGSPYEAIGSSDYYRKTLANLNEQHYVALEDSYGAPTPTRMRMVIKNELIYNPISSKFVQTLSYQKAKLMKIYKLKNEEYNRLALIAFGILGNETEFGDGLTYYLKEKYPTVVSWLKFAKNAITNRQFTSGTSSRGLTQIKTIPIGIKNYYCFSESQLSDPEVAAVSTVGFLAQSLGELRARKRAVSLDYINNENILDYVLYIYFGAAHRQLINADNGRDHATPERNAYIQMVKVYMSQVAIFENGQGFTPFDLNTCSDPAR